MTTKGTIPTSQNHKLLNRSSLFFLRSSLYASHGFSEKARQLADASSDINVVWHGLRILDRLGDSQVSARLVGERAVKVRREGRTARHEMPGGRVAQHDPEATRTDL